jgi:hypothetical protein
MTKSEPIYVEDGPPEYWVEVMNDEASHGLIIARFHRFTPATRFYEKLIDGSPLRVVMRQRAPVFRNYIPARLHNAYDRAREYPTD